MWWSTTSAAAVIAPIRQAELPQLVGTCAALAHEPRSCPYLRYRARRDTAAWPGSCRCACRWPLFAGRLGHADVGAGDVRRACAYVPRQCVRGPTSGYVSEQACVCPRPTEVRSGCRPKWAPTCSPRAAIWAFSAAITATWERTVTA